MENSLEKMNWIVMIFMTYNNMGTFSMTAHTVAKVFGWRNVAMNKEKIIELLNEADRNQMLPMIFGSLISADALTSANACRKSIEILEDFKEVIPESEVMNKDVWMKFVSEGLEIARKDLEKFEK